MNGQPQFTIEWQRLMERVAALQYGQIVVTIHQGKPTMIESEIQKIKLDGSQEDWKKELEMKPLL